MLISSPLPVIIAIVVLQVTTEGDGKFNNSPELYRTGWKDDWHATQEREVVEESVL
jgi:hypothetical protein